jgi:hypothetical protein
MHLKRKYLTSVILQAGLVLTTPLANAQEAPLSQQVSPKGWHDLSLSLGSSRYWLWQNQENVFRSLVSDQFIPEGKANFGSGSTFGNTIALGLHGAYSLPTPTYQSFKRLIRFGIFGGGSSGFFYSQSQRNSFVVDTLVSQRDGSLFFVDSVHTKSKSFTYSYGFIQSDFSYVVRGKGNRRVTLYGGAGITAGVSITPSTFISTSNASGKNIGLTPFNPDSIVIRQEVTNIEYADRDHKTGLNGQLYIPLGVELRLGNKGSSFGRTHLFYEARPQVAFVYVPEYGTLANIGLMHQLGVRVLFKAAQQ